MRLHPLIEIFEYTEVKHLLTRRDRGAIVGVAALSARGPTFVLHAPGVVLATGGVGQLYAVTTNPAIATADGWALAHRVGAELRDVEFLQFHPTALKLTGVNPAPLISEAVRGAGAFLVDHHGHRFALDADPRGELAPRDILARAVAAADAVSGAWLDARQIPDFAAQFPGITEMLARYGLDPACDLLPVAPALHYAMGGIRADLDGRTTRGGLWAVGEVACTGVHGANRLASNSLLEALVFADRAGRALAESPLSGGPTAAPLTPEAESGADRECEAIRTEMRSIMTSEVGVQRTEASLLRAQRQLARLARAVPPDAWRIANQVLVARLITRAARHRRESRGGHRRLDYPPQARYPEPVR